MKETDMIWIMAYMYAKSGNWNEALDTVRVVCPEFEKEVPQPDSCSVLREEIRGRVPVYLRVLLNRAEDILEG